MDELVMWIANILDNVGNVRFNKSNPFGTREERAGAGDRLDRFELQNDYDRDDRESRRATGGDGEAAEDSVEADRSRGRKNAPGGGREGEVMRSSTQWS
ncbi:hypothetical protein AXG93_2015s1090 [Marchantia polymorpha subsp. ruderalis]|uniref:Uncharacterized protein n=1 Tax=Marchantia polymorpha subsp. ruderalis TaxID=1480154 RepID=A0A176W415_MARPO|nr:hypothetical protein AXG93_2015s1090 [Marchantia polymorpha subsp. ruderalis]